MIGGVDVLLWFAFGALKASESERTNPASTPLASAELFPVACLAFYPL
jgi:hypothetical protein